MTIITLNINGRIIETIDKLEALRLLKPNSKYVLSINNACAFFNPNRIKTWSFPKKYKNKILSIEVAKRVYNGQTTNNR